MMICKIVSKKLKSFDIFELYEKNKDGVLLPMLISIVISKYDLILLYV